MQLHYVLPSVKLPLVLLYFLALPSLYAQQAPVAIHGVMDARGWDLKDKSLPLSGYWSFFDEQLLSPEACQAAYSSSQKFPALWNDIRTSESGTGYATYYLELLAPASNRYLALEVPQIYSSYIIWMNGKQIGNNGTPATTIGACTPQWKPQVIPFENTGDTLHLVMQLANFHHYLGGVRDPIYLGTYDLLTAQHSLALISTIVESIALFVIGLVVGFILYFQHNRKKVTLYFILLCFSWAIRALFSNLYVVTHFFPDFNWTLMVKIEYITLYFTMIWSILFISKLFPNEENKIVKYLLVAGNFFFVVFTLLTPPLAFTRWLPAYLIFCSVLLLHGAIVVVLALINERAGVWYLVFSILLAIGLFTLDVTAYQGIIVYAPVLFSLSYIVIFLLLTTALLYHLNIFKSKKVSGILTFEDMYGKSDRHI